MKKVPEILRVWFAELDRWSLMLILMLLAMGVVMSFSVAPEVAVRLKIPPYYIAIKHLFFAFISLGTLLCVSLCNQRMIKRIAVYMLLMSFMMLIFVNFWGESFNGSHRWLRVFGLTLQPSEFVKPAFAIIAAWLLTMQSRGEPVPGIIIIWVIYLILTLLLLLQPDVGQTIFLTLIFLVQWFVAGMPVMYLLLWMSIFLFGLVTSYLIFPHVTDRIQGFFSGADQYSQVNLSLRAFQDGGFLGEGLGGGTLKSYLFDAQSDFIFAVLGEELGIFACIMVLITYTFITLRSILRTLGHQDLFVVLALAGLLTQFAGQVWVNVGSVVGIIPPKGTTLPFISSGGTAMVAISFAMGAVLALGRLPKDTVFIATNQLKSDGEQSDDVIRIGADG
ncbi:MAG: FtsW/RodA/SpoVE family cell cycle protein [Alphaproteobacteria bacterium]|nr:FtsW/RodA/SpoVE family cell cycle protein [Alphaproteobacteria bacterium]